MRTAIVFMLLAMATSAHAFDWQGRLNGMLGAKKLAKSMGGTLVARRGTTLTFKIPLKSSAPSKKLSVRLGKPRRL